MCHVHTCRTKVAAAAGEPDAMRPSPDGPRRLSIFLDRKIASNRQRSGDGSAVPPSLGGRSIERACGYLGRDDVTRTARVVAAAGARRVLSGLSEGARNGSFRKDFARTDRRETRDPARPTSAVRRAPRVKRAPRTSSAQRRPSAAPNFSTLATAESRLRVFRDEDRN